MLSVYSFTGLALAQAQSGGGPAPSGIAQLMGSPLVMMGIIFAIIYFLIMRPQQKKQKEHQEMLRNLKKGDRVVTVSGMYGVVTALDEKIVALQVDDKVRIKVSRQSVASLSDEELKT
jgi:preprotein translocase subunit YajC